MVSVGYTMIPPSERQSVMVRKFLAWGLSGCSCNNMDGN